MPRGSKSQKPRKTRVPPENRDPGHTLHLYSLAQIPSPHFTELIPTATVFPLHSVITSVNSLTVFLSAQQQCVLPSSGYF